MYTSFAAIKFFNFDAQKTNLKKCVGKNKTENRNHSSRRTI